MLHAARIPSHAEALGFPKSLGGLPSIVGDAVAGDDGAGAVRAAPAVDEYRSGIFLIQDGQSLRDHRRARGIGSLHRNVNIPHSGCFHGPFLAGGTAVELT